MPPNDHFQACARTISHSESFAIHAEDLRKRPELYARVTRERLTSAAFVTARQYVQAQRLRRILTDKVDALFERCDVLLTAIIPGPAPVLEETDTNPWRNPQPLASVFNVTGHPCMAQPCGFAANGLPLSAQFVGRAFDEATVLRVGHAYEQAAGWVRTRPAWRPCRRRRARTASRWQGGKVCDRVFARKSDRSGGIAMHLMYFTEQPMSAYPRPGRARFRRHRADVLEQALRPGRRQPAL